MSLRRGAQGAAPRAAIGHAVAFPTWRSLTHDQGLSHDDAVMLMCALVEGASAVIAAGEKRPGRRQSVSGFGLGYEPAT